jgi:hypothetical protein
LAHQDKMFYCVEPSIFYQHFNWNFLQEETQKRVEGFRTELGYYEKYLAQVSDIYIYLLVPA